MVACQYVFNIAILIFITKSILNTTHALAAALKLFTLYKMTTAVTGIDLIWLEAVVTGCYPMCTEDEV